MSVLNSKIDFVALVSVTMANANGDPLNGNRPRTDYNNFGEISDVCIKRKIRNRMLDLGHKIFVQSEDKQDPNDTFPNLKMRAESVLSSIKGKDVFETRKLQHDKACETWLDVRSFGQLFAFSGDDKTSKKGSGVSLPVRGPVSIHRATAFLRSPLLM